MRPYYEDDLVTLFHGDALAITEWLTADVLLTDPPYGIAWKLGQAFKESKGDMRHAGIANDHSSFAFLCIDSFPIRGRCNGPELQQRFA